MSKNKQLPAPADKRAVINAGNARFDQELAELKEQFDGIERNLLSLYYQVGKAAATLKAKPGYYGSRTLEHMAQKLGWAYNNVRTASQYYTRITPEQVQQLSDARVSWRSVFILVSVKTDQKLQELIKVLLKGKMKSIELETIVRDFNTEFERSQKKIDASNEMDNRGTKSPKVTFKQIKSVGMRFNNFVLQAMEFALDFKDLTDQKKASFMEEFPVTREDLKTIKETITKFLKICTSIKK